MKRYILPRILCFIIAVLVLLLSSCAGEPTTIPGESTWTIGPSNNLEMETPSPTNPITATTEEIQSDVHISSISTTEKAATQAVTSGEVTVEATADTRRSPEDWRSWPVLPEHVSARAQEIYLRGLALGNDPYSFSVTGDCQAIRDVMLGEFDDPRKYQLKRDEQYLEETIDWYQGSFNRNGAAVRGGFTAASVLSPIHADPKMCKSGETPLGCEFRLHNPSILIISLEVWNDRAHLDRYELYLRQIIEYSIDAGVLPVLMTKADMAEALEHVINPLLIQLAHEYDLPLVNFWLAVQPLPDHGIDPARDGFHISEEAWWVKSISALKALDVVRRSLNQQELTAAASPTPQPTFTQAYTPTAAASTPSPTPIAVCSPAEDCVIFDFTITESGKPGSDGVFIMDMETGEVARLAGKGYRLQSVSPDSRFMLINQGSQLYLAQVNGQKPLLLTEDFNDSGGLSAFWLDETTIVVIADREGYPAVWSYKPAGEQWQRLTGLDDNPIRLYPDPNPEVVFWEAGSCSGRGECVEGGVWVTDTHKGSGPLVGVEQPEFSPDGIHAAFMDPEYTFEAQFGSNFRLVVEDWKAGLPSRRLIAFPPANGFQVRNRLESYTWSPDGSRIMIFLDERSNYYEKSAGYHIFQFFIDGGMMLEYERLIGETPRMTWAPDSERVLFAVTTVGQEGLYSPQFEMLVPASWLTRRFHLPPDWSGTEYRYIDRMAWIMEKP